MKKLRLLQASALAAMFMAGQATANVIEIITLDETLAVSNFPGTTPVFTGTAFITGSITFDETAQAVTQYSFHDSFMGYTFSSSTPDVISFFGAYGDGALQPIDIFSSNHNFSELFAFIDPGVNTSLSHVIVPGNAGFQDNIYEAFISQDNSSLIVVNQNPNGQAPEPASLALLGLGLAAMASRRRTSV